MSRKIVLILTEGETDIIALTLLAKHLREQKEDRIVNFVPMSGDITSTFDVAPENIADSIQKRILPALKENGLKAKDIERIIQVVDIDGVYIPDKNVVRDKKCQKAFYAPKEIKTDNPKKIRDRNRRKRENLNTMIRWKDLSIGAYTIPFAVYYFSCNMDHVISGDPNLLPGYKKAAAEGFMRNYIDDTDGYLKQLRTFGERSDFTGEKTYNLSWEWLKKGTNSLKAYTNVDLLI